ncbi:hypothetical protein ZMO1_ZMO2068 [Zymomonas mobilis subsp. mobilis ZM4 = ATCC 31821]|nr:hypothetical protein ZMO1_ZMO2068 [Zymomonas mobilis subsp. mobilis ZM4 = ATCC 31821]HCE37935.1 hypothetical protein [Zymomonas mobilis]
MNLVVKTVVFSIYFSLSKEDERDILWIKKGGLVPSKNRLNFFRLKLIFFRDPKETKIRYRRRHLVTDYCKEFG